MNKVEILSPVGSFEGLLACINAGCDAVYLSGNRFGARAYAENFDDEMLLEAIKAAHLFDVSVYLTVNTLIKEKEINDVISFLIPLVEANLDGVIVQDLGLIKVIHENFPHLSIHVSTQMSVTGPNFVKMLKNYNVNRIVPARELSLEEIVNIKKETGIEIECFIHGAMCYCYSGKCLFSSILGGRSGNRGRCAQPCRLPYNYNGKDLYPLSMKDMSTVDILPQLINAGIDSFKIEGRMKKPVYAAGVTSVYRKYVDLFYSHNEYIVSKEDINLLNHLYIRTGKSNGYYYRNNGKDMITLSSPSYNNEDEILIDRIQKEYVDKLPKHNISAKVRFVSGERIRIALKYNDIEIVSFGSEIQTAQKTPVTDEKIIELISKLNNTYFSLKHIEVENDNKGFISLKEINELRRSAVKLLEDKILGDYIVSHCC